MLLTLIRLFCPPGLWPRYTSLPRLTVQTVYPWWTPAFLLGVWNFGSCGLSHRQRVPIWPASNENPGLWVLSRFGWEETLISVKVFCMTLPTFPSSAPKGELWKPVSEFLQTPPSVSFPLAEPAVYYCAVISDSYDYTASVVMSPSPCGWSWDTGNTIHCIFCGS